MDRLRQRAMRSRTHIVHLLEHFYLDRIDVEQIQNLINAASGSKRRLLASYAHRLGELAQTYQALIEEYQMLQKRLGEEAQNAEVRIRQTAFPGVVIRIGGCERTIEVKTEHMRFFVEGDKLQQQPLNLK